MLVIVNAKSIAKLEQSIAKSPKEMKKAFEDYLWDDSVSGQVKNDIRPLIPVSDRIPRNRRGREIINAAYNPYSLKKTNKKLGFKVSTIRMYNYLRFPDEGSGTSAGKVPKEFFAKGLEKNEDRIINGLLEIAEKVLEWSK